MKSTLSNAYNNIKNTTNNYGQTDTKSMEDKDHFMEKQRR